MYCIFLLCSWGLCRFLFLVHIKRKSICQRAAERGGRVSRSKSDGAMHFGNQISPTLLKGRWRWQHVGPVCKLNGPTEKKCTIDRVNAKVSGSQRRMGWSYSVINPHTWTKAVEHNWRPSQLFLASTLCSLFKCKIVSLQRKSDYGLQGHTNGHMHVCAHTHTHCLICINTQICCSRKGSWKGGGLVRLMVHVVVFKKVITIQYNVSILHFWIKKLKKLQFAFGTIWQKLYHQSPWRKSVKASEFVSIAFLPLKAWTT